MNKSKSKRSDNGEQNLTIHNRKIVELDRGMRPLVPNKRLEQVPADLESGLPAHQGGPQDAGPDEPTPPFALQESGPADVPTPQDEGKSKVNKGVSMNEGSLPVDHN